VAARLRRLAAADVMRVVAVLDTEAFGYAYLAFGMIDVVGRSATDVAADLAKIPELVSVNVVTGRCDLFVRMLARDRAELAHIVGEKLAGVAGVRRVSCDVVVDIPRASPSRFGLLGEGGPPPVSLPPTLDEVDGHIIELLRVDARTSNRQIAASLGVSEGTVRNRVRRLQEEKFIRIQAVCDYEAFGRGIGALIGVNVQAGRVAEVQDALVAFGESQNVFRTVGSFDFVVIIFSTSQEHYIQTLHDQLARLPGVGMLSAFRIDIATKHVYAWTQVE
jgi:Lrp/AsnC family transcriptional regulator for asnA, asnC and gidA